MDIITIYSLTTLLWSLIQSLPLLLWPSLISTLLSSPPSSGHGYSQPDASCTDLETYYARSLALSQLAIGLFVFVLSGFLSLGGSSSSFPASTSDQAGTTSPGGGNDSNANPQASPYATAAITISTLHHASSAFYLYSRSLLATSSTGYVLGCTGNSLLACLGLWVLLFAGEKPHISRRTGKDKRISAFPFGVRHDKRK